MPLIAIAAIAPPPRLGFPATGAAVANVSLFDEDEDEDDDVAISLIGVTMICEPIAGSRD
jgi:hypothetical protein